VFSEIIKLVPSLDRAAMNSLFATLSRRFTEVAKKFGQGIKTAMKLSPFLAVAGAILSKILNPLEKAEEIIDKILNKGDDANTNAEEFGADPGKLLRLEAIGAAKGLDAATLRTLLGKFQGELAKEQEAAKDPNAKPGILREFVGETDTAQAFFSFVQAMQKLDKSRQVIVQSEVFGDKIRGKGSEFFNSTDFQDILNRLPSAPVLSKAAAKTGALSDRKDLDTAIRNTEDFVRKSSLVNETMVKDIDTSERQKLAAEDETLKRYDSLKSTSIAIQELTHKFDTFTTQLINDTAPLLLKAINELVAGVNIMLPYLEVIKNWTVTAFDGTLQAIADMSLAIEGYWNDFKNSRVYKWFGR